MLTRLAVLPLIGVLLGAIALVKTDVGFIVAVAPGGELDPALLAGLLCLLFVDQVGADQSRAARSSA